MKTFKEFLAQIYAHLEEAVATESKPGTKTELLARISTALKRTKRKSPERLNLLKDVRAEVKKGEGKGSDIIKAANKFGMSSKERAAKKRKETIQDLRKYYPETDYKKAQEKHDKLTSEKSGLEGHHIKAIHKSRKLKASMTDEQWRERVRRDAEQGVFHGHHPKNIMGAVTDKTPEHRARRGIRHRSGGAHELESKTTDLPDSVLNKGLLSAAHRRDLQQRVGPFKSTLLRAEREAEQRKKENG
jgi:hypothetical protein